MINKNIYHICTEQEWSNQIDSHEYTHPSLKAEDFIHCSEDHQVQGVLDRYFNGKSNLLILTIDTLRVIPKLQYDKAPIGEEFPHIYGPLNKDAIIDIKKINDKT